MHLEKMRRFDRLIDLYEKDISKKIIQKIPITLMFVVDFEASVSEKYLMFIILYLVKLS